MSGRSPVAHRNPSDPLGGTEVDSDTQATIDSMRGAGRPLAPDTAQAFGHHLNADLRNVRVHTGPRADHLARSVAATAFTAGSDVFFRHGAYNPGTARGDHLLAHELTHVAEGHSFRQPGENGRSTVGAADAPEEVRAEQSARRVVQALRRTPAPETSGPSVDHDHVSDPGRDHSNCRHVAGLRHARAGQPTLRRTGDQATLDPDLDLGAVHTDGVGPVAQVAPDRDPSASRSRARRGKVGPADLRADFLASMADPARQFLPDNIPSSGLGRFDAHYDPVTSVLTITVRPRFNFTGEWTDAERQTFVTNFQTQVKSSWSGKHEFACNRPGLEDLRAQVAVVVAPAEIGERAHFECEVTSQKAGATYIGREQYNDPTQLSRGKFAKADQTARPHDNLGTRCKMAWHDENRIKMFLRENLTTDAQGRGVIRFDAETMNSDDKAQLEKLVTILQKTKELGATPLPLIVTQFGTGFFSKAKGRAEQVRQVLAKNGHYPVRVERAKDQLAALKKERAKDLAIGLGDDEQARARIAAKESDLGSTNITIEADAKFAKTYVASDPYSILAHEFGHMLGNPDEYFGYGAGMLALKKEELLRSANEGDHQIAKNLKESTDATGQRGEIQQRWGEVVQAAGQTLPTMTRMGSDVTHSIMSAGTIALPAHYATIWEALGRITSRAVPGIPADAWRMQ